MKTEPSTAALAQLLDIMARLRDRERGCPWDLEQTFATIAPYTIEEAYEVADAIERGDLGELKDELGDLLFPVVFHSRMAEEAGAFAFADVAAAIYSSIPRRACARRTSGSRAGFAPSRQRWPRAASPGRATTRPSSMRCGGTRKRRSRSQSLERRGFRGAFRHSGSIQRCAPNLRS